MEETFHLRDVEVRLVLRPYDLASASMSILRHLDQQLLKYSEELEGALVAYEDLAKLDSNGSIFYETPTILLPIQFRALVFSPKVGQHIVGVVNKVGDDHIGLLVQGVFNASIPVKAIRSEFQRLEGEECWQSATNQRVTITLDSHVHFEITSVDVARDRLSLMGSLQHPATGPLPVLGGGTKRKSTNVSPIKKKPKPQPQSTQHDEKEEKEEKEEEQGKQEESQAFSMLEEVKKPSKHEQHEQKKKEKEKEKEKHKKQKNHEKSGTAMIPKKNSKKQK